MGDRDMTAIRSVLMFVLGMLDTAINGALIPMVIMLMVQMPIMHVIKMIVMGNCRMTAIRSMNMWVFVLHFKIMPQAGSFRRKGVSQFALENLS